ncbi:MAG: zf-HC2 domain-containing protein, partial [Planctomycetota bacterium]
MKNVPENELFSAYLDGELTADEQAEVERLLAASPAARQLVDELRALSASLQALPTYRIGEDISARVLRRAERRMLSEPAPAGPGVKDATQAEGPPWLALLRRVARPRNLVWPGVAVAVALLFMVFGPDVSQEPSGGTIAMRTPDELAEFQSAPEMAPPMGAAADEAGEMFVDVPVAAEPAREE